MNQSLKDKLIEGLKSTKAVKDEDLKKALEKQAAQGGSLSHILIEMGVVSQKDIMVLLSQQLNIPPINLSKYKVNPEVVKLIPEKVAKQYKVFPISTLKNMLTVAMADPTNIIAMDDIKTLTNYNIDLVIASESDIENAINEYYRKEEHELNLQDIMTDDEGADSIELVEGDGQAQSTDVSDESNKAPIVKLVAMILNEALANRASDIHVEPQERSLRVRYRVDGQLHESIVVPKKNQNAILARLKIMSKLDITENRIPQDGRFKIGFRDREVDFRVSVLPTTFGNKVVMRALDRTSLSVGLDTLGFSPEVLGNFKKGISRPYGMILITGPTGSGKSTTLYSILNKLNIVDRNIITIEDPVEYQLQGITQIQINPDIGLTFAKGLRSVLRQSPDIVMVGEIRDSETADIAIKASLTGQLVLSTLHTNDAPSAVTRLIDMGVEPFLIASSVIMTAAQRLVRKICPHCREEYKVPQQMIDKLGPIFKEIQSKTKAFYHGKGCAKCKKSGYLGRIAILETFMVDDELRMMIGKKESADHLRNYAVKKGMKTLRDDALLKFASGVTSLEEVLRVTSED